MRVNMNAMNASERPPQSLMNIWCHMLASEYLVEPKMAIRWVHNMDSRAFVVEFLQSKGWKVEAYTTPSVDSGFPPSHGFVIADDCENFVAWRLAQD